MFNVPIKLILIFLFLFLSCGKKIQLQSFLNNDNLWTMYGRIPERNFYLNDSINLPLKVKFKLELKAGLYSSSVTSRDDFIFIGDLKGNVYKISLSKEKIENVNSFNQPILTSIVVTEKELIIPLAELKNKNSVLIVYDLINGRVKSKIYVEGSIEKEILLLEDFLILTTSKGLIYKLNRDYTIDWKLDLQSCICSTPSASKNFFVVSTENGYLFIITFEGKILQKFKVNHLVQSGFAIENDNIFFGDDGGYLYLFNFNQGKIIYAQKLDTKIISIPSLDEHNLYVGDLRGNIFAINKSTGSIIWRKNYGGMINNAILIVGDKLIVPNVYKKIFILNKFDGKILQEVEVEGRVKLSPVLIKDKIICGYDDKKIVAFSN